MNKPQAKREACFHASVMLETALAGGDDFLAVYSGADAEKVDESMKELINELRKRGYRERDYNAQHGD